MGVEPKHPDEIAAQKAQAEKFAREQSKRQDTIARGLARSADLARKGEELKAGLRGGKTESEMWDDLYREKQELLERIARCPGLENAPFGNTGPAGLDSGMWGLKSRWYKRLNAVVMGIRESNDVLARLEEEVKQFRERLAVVYVASLPEISRRDWVVERPFWKEFGGRPFDFSHLSQKTAKELAAALSTIESELCSLQSSNDIHMNAWAE